MISMFLENSVLNEFQHLNHYRPVSNPFELISNLLFYLILSPFYSLMPLSYHDQRSLIHKKWKQHGTPVSVAPQSGSYPSAFEENAEDSLFLTFRDDI